MTMKKFWSEKREINLGRSRGHGQEGTRKKTPLVKVSMHTNMKRRAARKMGPWRLSSSSVKLDTCLL